MSLESNALEHDLNEGVEAEMQEVALGEELEWEGELPVLPEPPAHLSWVHELEEEHPRWRIRRFLVALFAQMGLDWPEEWPDIPAAAFGDLFAAVQRQLRPLYGYVEPLEGITKEQRFMPRYLGETASYLMRLDWLYPDEMHDLPMDLIEWMADRPAAIIDFDQLYCTPDTSFRRAQRVRERFDAPECKVLMLGDDDLVSMALARDFSGEVHMIDLDDRLHEYMKRKEPSIFRHKADFVKGGISRSLYQQFDAVMLDPPWENFRLWRFLEKAMYCLKDSMDARIYMSYCPLVLEHHDNKFGDLQARLGSWGFTLDRVETAFNLYDLSPRDLPQFQARLAKMMPPVDSPLLQFLRLVPFAHSQLFVIRRLPFDRPNWFRRQWFFWWNSESALE